MIVIELRFKSENNAEVPTLPLAKLSDSSLKGESQEWLGGGWFNIGSRLTLSESNFKWSWLSWHSNLKTTVAKLIKLSCGLKLSKTKGDSALTRGWFVTPLSERKGMRGGEEFLRPAWSLAVDSVCWQRERCDGFWFRSKKRRRMKEWRWGCVLMFG